MTMFQVMSFEGIRSFSRIDDATLRYEMTDEPAYLMMVSGDGVSDITIELIERKHELVC